MNAKDTVMSWDDINLCGIKNVMASEDARAIAKAQAEISFKAGQQSGSFVEGIAVGRKEVVEYVRECEKRNPAFFSYIQIEKFYWQAKLKDWGIEK